MQTFLPYPDFQKSVQSLDWRRLGKQRVEAYQLLRTLHIGTKGWQNHPACLMWTGYENALAAYMNCCIKEWIRRGYKNTMLLCLVDNYKLPPWFGQEDFHSSHRSNLLRKDEEFYRQFGWLEDSEKPYLWPMVHQKVIQFRIIHKKKPPQVSFETPLSKAS